MLNRSKLFVLLLTCAVVLTSSAQAKKLNVITATTDFAALAQEVGGDKIDVESIAKGYQDPHFVEAKPSFLLKLRHADLLVVVGLDLEIGWLPPLITQSGNPKIQPASAGYLDASQKLQVHLHKAFLGSETPQKALDAAAAQMRAASGGGNNP